MVALLGALKSPKSLFLGVWWAGGRSAITHRKPPKSQFQESLGVRLLPFFPNMFGLLQLRRPPLIWALHFLTPTITEQLQGVRAFPVGQEAENGKSRTDNQKGSVERWSVVGQGFALASRFCSGFGRFEALNGSFRESSRRQRNCIVGYI